jgi:pyridoxal biosynthesis lyase PdxS
MVNPEGAVARNHTEVVAVLEMDHLVPHDERPAGGVALALEPQQVETLSGEARRPCAGRWRLSVLGC